ncbi:hypothetical protein ACP8HI_11740 [Paenibacillus sp. FA6]|uniref:hypothetical protein n=1 Tax=Paenibacillus sp. FA6 TaxID=3413029 RepID=UPI003F655AF3
MKKKYISISAGLFAVLLTGSLLYSQSINPKEKVKNGFDSSQASLPLVVGDGIEITADRFILYKKNAELVQTPLSDDEIINELIKKELSIQYAENLGLEVVAQEIDDVIAYERAALNDPNLDPDNNVVKELMSNRIRITGLTEDEFWNTEETRYGYESAIFLGKLFEHLVEEGNIKDMTEFNEFQIGLLNDSQDKLQINYDVIK